MDRDKLFAHLDEYLGVSQFKDYCPNGLQVEGTSQVEKIALGVSVNQALIDQAIEWGADTIMAHHGLFWRGDPQRLTGFRRNRLKAVLENDINVAGYHLPLDAHPQVGNNACIARELGLVDTFMFGSAGGQPLGLAGTLKSAVPAAELLRKVIDICDSDAENVVSFLNGPALVQKVGVITGGGGKMIEDAIDAEVDFYITGEPEEPSMGIAAEAGIHFVAAGHHRTETFGIKALGEHIAARFGVETRFFEISNPV